MKASATTMPSGVNATLMPQVVSVWPSQPFGAYRAVSAMPASQHPRQQQPEHDVEKCCDQRTQKADPIGSQHARRRDGGPERLDAEVGRFEHRGRQRQQHDQAQVEHREAERQSEARQHAIPSKPATPRVAREVRAAQQGRGASQ
jgi:hypothetical protein